jgi:hypothetical protein
MQHQFDVRNEYAKDRNQQDENRYFVIGMVGMVIAFFLVLALFLWIYTGINPLH